MQKPVSENDILQQYEDELKFIIDAADLATWVVNPLTNELTGNQKLRELFFLPPHGEIDVAAIESRILEEDIKMLRAANAWALNPASEGNYKVEYGIINPYNKSIKKVLAIGKVAFDVNKKPYRFSGTIQDITEEKQILAGLQQSEKHFRNIVRQAPIGITIFTGFDFMVEMANDNYLQLIDRKEKEFVGKPLFESLPEVKEYVEGLLTGVFTTGVPYYGFEFPVTLNRYGKKELAHFNFVYHPLRDDAGNIYGIIVVAFDVTPSVIARHTLAESEKQFRNLIMQSPIPMTIFRGEDFVIEIANHVMFKTLWRKKEEDVLNKKLLNVFPELQQQKFPELLKQVYTSGKAYSENESVAYVQGDDGMKKFYLDFEYAPLFDIENKPSGIFVTVNDVTEKVLARQKIADAEERARLAISAAELGVYEVDINTKQFTGDKRFYELFGVNETATWQQIINVVHPDDMQLRNEAHEKSSQTGMLEYEARLLKKDGSIIWVRIRGKLIFNGNEPVKLLGILQDITKQKQFEAVLENEVEERTKELGEANRRLHLSNVELNQFAYVASHDLQEPLRKVRTFIDLMRVNLGEIPDKSRIYIDKINSSAERMQNLISDVLKFSLLSKEREKFEEADLNIILQNIVNDFELMIEQKNAVIEINELPVIEAIALQMGQLFTNLLSNALKFGIKDSQLKITVTANMLSKDELKENGINSDTIFYKIEFKDNGIGFDQENAEKIFTIFQRLHGRAEYEGTGIGLAMCKKIVQNHHGFIMAQSSLNNGAAFTIILPQKQDK